VLTIFKVRCGVKAGRSERSVEECGAPWKVRLIYLSFVRAVGAETVLHLGAPLASNAFLEPFRRDHSLNYRSLMVNHQV
jgi:hypothetical protein